jgi:hypothetical protein
LGGLPGADLRHRTVHRRELLFDPNRCDPNVSRWFVRVPQPVEFRISVILFVLIALFVDIAPQ